MNELVERPLTATEIRQRQVDHLSTLAAIDTYRDEVAEHRRCVKEAAAEIERLEQRERDLRRELRSGTCWVARQQPLEFAGAKLDPVTDILIDAAAATAFKGGTAQDMIDDLKRAVDHVKGARDASIDASTDEPAPETDPPGPPDWYVKFETLYPIAKGHGSLRDDLHEALTDEQYAKLPNGTVESWKTDTGIFQGVANWARTARARKDSTSRAPGLEGVTFPEPGPMPAPLAELLGDAAPKPKKKRGARPLSSPAPRKKKGEATA
jgi:hypothetical protein